MILNNLIIIINGRARNTSSASGVGVCFDGTTNADIKWKDSSWDFYPFYLPTSTGTNYPYYKTMGYLSNGSLLFYNGASYNNTMAGSCGIIIGTGTTPPTVDDYTFSGSMITDFTGTTSLTVHPNGVGATGIYGFTNTGASAFTIGEIGLSGQCNNNSSAVGYNKRLLLTRDVLDTPLTIEPGETKYIRYDISLV